jgi:hypothetical protein
LAQLTQDIRDNWDTTYSVNAFPPAKAFDGDKIDATKNWHILRVIFQGVPLIAELIKYFEEKYTHLEVQSVWMIEKSKENDGFQGWHRDLYLGTEVTTTIVVNVGAATRRLGASRRRAARRRRRATRRRSKTKATGDTTTHNNGKGQHGDMRHDDGNRRQHGNERHDDAAKRGRRATRRGGTTKYFVLTE